ncbi:MAG: GNAT family N-acetyltransferase [Chloroflexi bacterium]|nr:GNAT family N-acetyltransferase [Chloroflexota bacterium]
MRGRALAAAMQRAEAAIVGGLLPPGTVRRVGGVVCLTAPFIPHPFVNRAIGFGTFADPDEALLERIERLFERAGTPPRVTLPGDLASTRSRRLLDRRGFTLHEPQLDSVLLHDAAGIPDPPAIRGLTIERLRPEDVTLYARTAAASFPERPRFEEAVLPVARRAIRSRTLHPFLARIDGEAAGTGLLTFVGRVAGMSNGTVLERFRGRGIQKALLARRMREGLRRGYRVFFSQTQTQASLHNMLDLDWRVLYVNADYERR